MKRSLFLCGLLLIIGCRQTPQQDAHLSGNSWQVDSPEAVGLDSRGLEKLTGELRSGSYGNIHAVLIARQGRLVYEAYFAGEDDRLGTALGRVEFHRETLHDIRSISKTITALLIGIAQQRGEIDSLDTPLVKLLPKYAHLLTDGKEKISLRHVLTMSAGLQWDEDTLPYTNPMNDERRLSRSEDPAAFVLNRALTSPPGTVFNYSGGLTHLLGVVLQTTTGLPVDQYAEKVLFKPLGIKHWEWLNSGNAKPSTYAGLRLRAIDLAKMGQLLLNAGRWKEDALLPDSWASEAMQTHISYNDSEAPDYILSNGYGYQLWTNDFQTDRGKLYVATAVGNGEQRVIVLPQLSMVVTMLAGFYDDPDNTWTPENILIEKILPCLQ